MNSIQLLIREHDNILRMLEVIRAASLLAVDGGKVDVGDFKRMVEFIRRYADGAHHGKEEVFLFKSMLDELGSMGANLIRQGMLVEHDLGRLYVSDLDAALDDYASCPTREAKLSILVSAGSYERLLRRHIDKENDVVFSFGQAKLSRPSLTWLEEQTEIFEADEANAAERERQLKALEMLEKKYGPKHDQEEAL